MIVRLAFLSTLLILSSGRPARSQVSGGDAAANLYGRMAEAILKAKTLQVTCKADFKTAGFEAEAKCSLLMKEGNKMRLEVETKGIKDQKAYSHTLCMVSDGRFIKTRENTGAWDVYATTKDWNQSLLLNVIRGGLPSGLELDRIKSKERTSVEDVGIAFFPVPEPREFALWKKEEFRGRAVTPIEFTVTSSSGFFRENSVILWVDTATGLPAKRLNVIQSDRMLRVAEIYESILLDEAVEDSRFAAPKD